MDRADSSPIAAPRRIAWAGIALFYAIALLVAAPFNSGLADGWLRATFPGTPVATWTFLPAALGPLIGALIASRLAWRPSRIMSLLGVDPRQALLVALVPLVAFPLIGGTGVALTVAALAYALGEEFGWRGYLADALAPLAPLARYGLTALLWWPWHLRFATTFDWIGFPLLVLGSSVVLGHAARTSRSVLVAAAMHATVILLTVNGSPTRALAIAGGVTLIAWMALGTVMPPGSDDATPRSGPA